MSDCSDRDLSSLCPFSVQQLSFKKESSARINLLIRVHNYKSEIIYTQNCTYYQWMLECKLRTCTCCTSTSIHFGSHSVLFFTSLMIIEHWFDSKTILTQTPLSRLFRSSISQSLIRYSYKIHLSTCFHMTEY